MFHCSAEHSSHMSDKYSCLTEMSSVLKLSFSIWIMSGYWVVDITVTSTTILRLAWQCVECMCCAQQSSKPAIQWSIEWPCWWWQDWVGVDCGPNIGLVAANQSCSALLC